MSRRQDIQSAEGMALRYPIYGTLQYVSKAAPVGGEVGFAPGCDWYVPTATGTLNKGLKYVNIGSNGYGSNAKASWIQADNSYTATNQAGGGTGLVYGGGQIYRTYLTTANKISPSATGALKIVDYFTLPASTLIASGQGIEITVFTTVVNNVNTKRIAVVFNPSNTGMPANPTAYGGTNAGITGQTDGTVTVTGGDSAAPVLDTGAGGASAAGNYILYGQLFKTGAAASNTQEAATTSVVAPGSHSGAGGTVGAWTDKTLTESAAITIAICVLATTTATDISYQGCQILFFN